MNSKLRLSIVRRTEDALVALVLVAFALAFGGAMIGCKVQPSRVARGQLVTIGDPRYDDFFAQVHALQYTAATWGDERRTARKSLIASLDLTADAADVSISQAMHERAESSAKEGGSTRLEIAGEDVHAIATGGAKADARFFKAVEESARFEVQRATRMHAIAPKIGELTATGHTLVSRLPDDFPSKVRRNQVQKELTSALSVLETIGRTAKRDAREAEDYAADMQRAFKADADGAAPPAAAVTTPPAAAGPAASTKKPANGSKPSDAKPEPAPNGEVFTP